MENWYKTIAFSRGVAGLLWRVLLEAEEGIISKGAFPLCKASPTNKELDDATKTGGRRSTNIRKSAVETLLRLVSTPLNKGSCWATSECNIDRSNHISGTESEKLEWFRIINIAGAKLTNQELRNAVYAGTWVSDAKRYFSRTGGPAYHVGQDYLNGKPIRQEYLETAIKWISGGDIEEYMARHQHDENAKDLWEHYQSVIGWVERNFTEKRPKIMKGVDWGTLYDSYKDETLDPAKIEEEIERLILDDDVTKQSGIYPYILTREEKHLNIRKFSDSIKQKVYEKQNGKCKKCNKNFDIGDMEADHITPWVEGGKTNEDNCQLLCKDDNRRKSSK